MYARGASNYYAGVFDSDVGIQRTGGGSCSGCGLAYPAYNVGREAIEASDYVAVSGVQVDEDLQIPVLQLPERTALANRHLPIEGDPD